MLLPRPLFFGRGSPSCIAPSQMTVIAQLIMGMTRSRTPLRNKSESPPSHGRVARRRVRPHSVTDMQPDLGKFIGQV
jgi:hypothetical protein